MFDSWLNQRAFHSHAGHADAITRIRMFLRYLRSVSGKDVFIPGDDYSVIKVKPYPYIYTDDELKRLFKAIDSFPPDSPFSHAGIHCPRLIQDDVLLRDASTGTGFYKERGFQSGYRRNIHPPVKKAERPADCHFRRSFKPVPEVCWGCPYGNIFSGTASGRKTQYLLG